MAIILLHVRDEETAIRTYFQMGFSYEAILAFCATYHHTIISLRTLKRRLKQFGLCRWGSSSWATISSAIHEERTGPGTLYHRHVLRGSVKRSPGVPDAQI